MGFRLSSFYALVLAGWEGICQLSCGVLVLWDGLCAPKLICYILSPGCQKVTWWKEDAWGCDQQERA